VWTTAPHLTRFPRIPGDVRRFGAIPAEVKRIPRESGGNAWRGLRGGYFHFVDRMKPTMMKPKPMPTLTSPFACPPMEFITGIWAPAT
jgi:hypothetical protein